MWVFDRVLGCGAGCLVALALLTACNGGSGAGSTRSAPEASAQAIETTTSVVAAEKGLLMKKWIDLQAGDCLADPPPTDPGVAEVSVVDCAIPHSAEVYLRADVEVNAAIADVADRQCNAGFAQYTGQPVAGSPLAVSYLIDSNQDRTSNDRLPSTVICLLQAAKGGPLTGSARR